MYANCYNFSVANDNVNITRVISDINKSNDPREIRRLMKVLSKRSDDNPSAKSALISAEGKLNRITHTISARNLNNVNSNVHRSIRNKFNRVNTLQGQYSRLDQNAQSASKLANSLREKGGFLQNGVASILENRAESYRAKMDAIDERARGIKSRAIDQAHDHRTDSRVNRSNVYNDQRKSEELVSNKSKANTNSERARAQIDIINNKLKTMDKSNPEYQKLLDRRQRYNRAMVRNELKENRTGALSTINDTVSRALNGESRLDQKARLEENIKNRGNGLLDTLKNKVDQHRLNSINKDQNKMIDSATKKAELQSNMELRGDKGLINKIRNKIDQRKINKLDANVTSMDNKLHGNDNNINTTMEKARDLFTNQHGRKARQGREQLMNKIIDNAGLSDDQKKNVRELTSKFNKKIDKRLKHNSKRPYQVPTPVSKILPRSVGPWRSHREAMAMNKPTKLGALGSKLANLGGKVIGSGLSKVGRIATTPVRAIGNKVSSKIESGMGNMLKQAATQRLGQYGISIDSN